MDKITSGMKRIKINLITQAQKEARQRSRAQQNLSVTSEDKRDVRSGNSTPLVSPTTLVSGGSPSIEGTIKTPTAGDFPASVVNDPNASAFAPSEDELGEMVALPALPQVAVDSLSSRIHGSSSLALSSPPIPQVEIQPSSDPADIFIPYQPEGPTPVPTDSAETLKWLPPNFSTPATTPSPVKKQPALYHHTPGSIPFAPRGEPEVNNRNVPEEGEAASGNE